MDTHDPNTRARLEQAYENMVERVRAFLDRAGHSVEDMQKGLSQARDTAVELGELSRQEADLVSAWVRRDLHDAGEYLERTGHELRDWLHMDLELLEHSLLDLIGRAADQTRLELLKFEEQATHTGEYRSGEVTGPGTLECSTCGALLRFQQAGHIPPCPTCHGTYFRRKSREEQQGTDA